MKQSIKEEGKEPISLRISNKTNQNCATNVLAVDNFESALKDFMKLSIDCGNNKFQFDHQQNSRIAEKSLKMYTTERLRFRPYKIPENILNANLQYKKQQSKEKDRDQKKIWTAKTTSSTPQRNLIGIGLEGCNFRSTKAAISKTAIRPKPCWLQHQQRCGGAFRIVEKLPATDEEDELELKEVEQQFQPGIGDGEQQQPKPSPNPDLGLNELSDYFQHFVCLRAPKMSDLAQSMYA